MFVKLNMYNNLVSAPTTFTTDDCRIVTNFNTNINLMREYGFKELLDIRPNVNENQYIVILGYSETEDNIIVNYEIKDKEIVEQINIEEKLLALEKENEKLKAELEDISIYAIENSVDTDYRLTLLEINAMNK